MAEQWRGIAVTVGINWLIKPFSMALLGWLFIGWLFRPFLPAGQIDSYIAGLIILAAAPCTAMVFVWSNLTDGDPNFTLSQVALNDTIMVFAFAPRQAATKAAGRAKDVCDLARRERVGDIEHPRTGRSPLLPLRAVQAKQALFLAINFPPLPGIRYCGRGSREAGS